MNHTRIKKYIPLCLVLASLLVSKVVWAQIMPAPENLSTTSTSSLANEPIIIVESTSTTNIISPTTPKGRTNVVQEQRVALPEVRQTRIRNLAANISNRMDAAVVRLFTISSRLEQRIIKTEEFGIETSFARENLLLANKALATAELKLSDIDNLVDGAIYSTKPRNDWRIVRERYQEVSSLINQAHLALRDSIITLKNPVLKTQVPNTNSTDINPIPQELISN